MIVAEVVREVEVLNANGIHVRPSSQIVEATRAFQSSIALENGELTADARSVIGLLQLQAMQGARLKIRATGEDAEQAVEALVELFNNRFGFET